jgi:hypothetical protein
MLLQKSRQSKLRNWRKKQRKTRNSLRQLRKLLWKNRRTRKLLHSPKRRTKQLWRSNKNVRLPSSVLRLKRPWKKRLRKKPLQRRSQPSKRLKLLWLPSKSSKPKWRMQ